MTDQLNMVTRQELRDVMDVVSEQTRTIASLTARVETQAEAMQSMIINVTKMVGIVEQLIGASNVAADKLSSHGQRLSSLTTDTELLAEYCGVRLPRR